MTPDLSIDPPLILGVDPGSQVTGYAVVSCVGRTLRRVDSGTIRLPGGRTELSGRLGRLLERLEGIIESLRPTEVAVEDIFTARNPRSALALGQARGVVLAVAGRQALPVHGYPPATVKRAVCGHGRADKKQIQRMVQVLLSLDKTPAQDEADAIAVAICHALSRKRP
jgi:crossover junction endodeoxyribonuclease RuvC